MEGRDFQGEKIGRLSEQSVDDKPEFRDVSIPKLREMSNDAGESNPVFVRCFKAICDGQPVGTENSVLEKLPRSLQEL